MRKTIVVTMTLLILAAAAAAVPQYISYQGMLRDADGNLQNTTIDMTFRIYDDADDGNLKNTPDGYTKANVLVSKGLYNVQIPADSTIFDGVGDRYLEIQVGSDILKPRLQINSVAYAIRAEVAGSAAYATLAGTASTAADAQAKYVDISGDTMTGTLTLSANPTSNMDAATMQYVDDTVGAAGGGDITEVIAGLGLIDGGTLGAVTLNVGAGTGIDVAADMVGIADLGVTNAKLAANAVNSAKIANGTILSADIKDAEIVDADISSEASIAQSKIDNTTRAIDADMVDTYHAGNASGNVPISNGTLNTNLNADQVDGIDASSTPTADTLYPLDGDGKLSGISILAEVLYINGTLEADAGYGTSPGAKACGLVTIEAGANTATVTNGNVTPNSIILITQGPYTDGDLDKDGVYVHTQSAGSFIVKVQDGTTIAGGQSLKVYYLIIN